MKRTLCLLTLLGLSVAANVVLLDDDSWITGIARSWASRSGSNKDRAPAPVVAAPVRELSAAQQAELWSKLFNEDPAEFTHRLREAGFPSEILRALVTAQIDDLLKPREEALLGKPTKNEAWWKGDEPPSVAAQLALLGLRREKLALRERVLGPDPDPEESPLYDNLPEEKRAAVRLITEDYNLRLKILRGNANILLPAERTQISELKKQQEHELGELLDEEQLAEYRIRTSTTTEALRERWGSFPVSEEEFRAVFSIQKNYAEAGSLSPIDERRRLDEFVHAFGEERGNEVLRALTPEFAGLRRLVARSGLPGETANQVFALRDKAASESSRLSNDPTLPDDAKLAAFRSLAEKTKTEIGTKLGPDASAAYLPVGASWLKSVARGEVVSFSSPGWQSEGLAREADDAAVSTTQVVFRPQTR